MKKQVKLEVNFSMGLVGCKRKEVLDIEIDTEWSEKELDDNLSEIAIDWMWERAEIGYGIIE